MPSCSAAAARNVSPAAITTVCPSSVSRLPSLPMVVVLPTPLTPTNSHTRRSLRRRSCRSRSKPESRSFSSAFSASSSCCAVGEALGLDPRAQVVEQLLGRLRRRRRRGSAPPRARPTSRRRSCRARRASRRSPPAAPRALASRSRKRGLTGASALDDRFGLGDDGLGLGRRDRFVDRFVAAPRRPRPRRAAPAWPAASC